MELLSREKPRPIISGETWSKYLGRNLEQLSRGTPEAIISRQTCGYYLGINLELVFREKLELLSQADPGTNIS